MKKSRLASGFIFLSLCLLAISCFVIRHRAATYTEERLSLSVERVFKDHEKQYLALLRRYFPRYKQLSDNIITYKGFCYPASLVLGALLQEHGIQNLYMAVVDKGDGGHTFLFTRIIQEGKEIEHIIDPTYRQFLIPLSENELEHDFGKMPVILVVERGRLRRRVNELIREFVSLGNTIKPSAPASKEMDDFLEFWEPVFVVGSEFTRNFRRTSFEETIGQYSRLSLLLNIQVDTDTIMNNFAATVPFYIDNNENFWFYHDCLLANPPFIKHKQIAEKNSGGIAYLKGGSDKEDVFEIIGVLSMKTEGFLLSQLVELNNYYDDICFNWNELGLFRDFPHVLGQAIKKYLSDNERALSKRGKQTGLIVGYGAQSPSKGIDYLDIQKYINNNTIYDLP